MARVKKSDIDEQLSFECPAKQKKIFHRYCKSIGSNYSGVLRRYVFRMCAEYEEHERLERQRQQQIDTMNVHGKHAAEFSLK